MARALEDFAEMVKDIRQQSGFSQEELGVSFATINRWENGKMVPFNLTRSQFQAFCERMKEQGKLTR